MSQEDPFPIHVENILLNNHDTIQLFTVKLTDSLKINLLRVEVGSFTMGSETGFSNESPVRKVEVSEFLIGQFEVTQELWKFVMDSNPSYFIDCKDCPAERITFFDATQFLERLNKLTGMSFRLPTEAEWEYAAGGGHLGKKIFKYAGSSKLDEVAWYLTNSMGKTHPVGSKNSNVLGIYDLSGNVFEWTADWAGKYRKNALLNPTGPEKGKYKVIRGGCWHDIAEGCRIKCRVEMKPDEKNGCVGFRLAHNVTIPLNNN